MNQTPPRILNIKGMVGNPCKTFFLNNTVGKGTSTGRRYIHFGSMLKNIEIRRKNRAPEMFGLNISGTSLKDLPIFFPDQKAREDILSRVYTTSDFANRAAEPASGAKPSAPISSAKAWVTGAPPTMTLT